jgi:hypothetical protein
MQLPERFYFPRFSPAGIERIRLAMLRGHSGDDPDLPIRQLRVRRGEDEFVVWLGPVDRGGPEAELWEMEIDMRRFPQQPHELVAAARRP